MIKWDLQQEIKVGFIIIEKSNYQKSMLLLACERSGGYKAPKKKKKLKLEDTSPRECECLFRLHGYLKKKYNQWCLAILNGVHNHRMETKLEGHLLVGKLTENDKKVIAHQTKILVQPKHILMNLKGKRK